MNILRSDTRENSSFAMGKIRPPFDLSSDRVVSYVYCKALMEISCGGHEYDVALFRKVFTEDEMKKICSVYIEVVKDKEPERHEHFFRKDGSYDYSEILHSFSDSLKERSGLYFQILFYACQKKLDEVFAGCSPFSDIVDSPFMKNFALAFSLQRHEVVFLCLNLINSRFPFLFSGRMDDETKLAVLREFCDNPVILMEKSLKNLNRRLTGLGLFYGDWEVASYVSSYFYGNPYPFRLQDVNPDEHGDCYSMDSISSENSADLQVIDTIISQCREDNKGCYITVSNRSVYRIRNYVSYHCSCGSCSTVEVISDRQDFSRNSFIFFLVAASCQLQALRTMIMVGPSLLRNLLSDSGEDKTGVTFFFDSDEDDGQDEAHGINWSVFQYIQSPVFLLVDGLNRKEAERLDDSIKIVYRWCLKTPPENEYQEQFVKFLADKDVDAEMIRTVADECGRLKVKPKKWMDVAALISAVYPESEPEMKQLIRANFEGKKDSSGIRRNSHYSLEALRTTEPVENIVKALRNAERLQRSGYDSDSGIRILNYGISGTGKTAFVENVASMLDRPLRIVRASDILGTYVGETERNIRDIFREAAATDSILLIDEADSFLHCRGDSVNRHNDLKVNEFLVQMERYPGILFCNTNLPDSLDPAADRRFHKKIGFNPLDRTGVSLLLRSYFEGYSFTDEQTDRICSSGDVTPGDFGALSGRLRFFAPEDLTSDAICDELVGIVEGKKRSWEKTKTIGFGV